VYVLDTNVISELRKNKPHGAVLAWLQTVNAHKLFLSAVTIGEIQAGIENTRKQDAKKAQEIEAWLEQIIDSFGVLPMDGKAFRIWAQMMHGRSDAIYDDARGYP
jgi:toxin FitB